jgi:hypothetical protein
VREGESAGLVGRVTQGPEHMLRCVYELADYRLCETLEPCISSFYTCVRACVLVCGSVGGGVGGMDSKIYLRDQVVVGRTRISRVRVTLDERLRLSRRGRVRQDLGGQRVRHIFGAESKRASEQFSGAAARSRRELLFCGRRAGLMARPECLFGVARLRTVVQMLTS